MRFTRRLLEHPLRKAARQFSAAILTGPRRSGKTTLLKHLFPRATYVLLEDPDVVARVRADPHAFLDEVHRPAILDEIQNAPELLNYKRAIIDRAPSRKGDWLLTGSQDAPLMRGVTESMAGRAAILQLLPLARQEDSRVSAEFHADLGAMDRMIIGEPLIPEAGKIAHRKNGHLSCTGLSQKIGYSSVLFADCNT